MPNLWNFIQFQICWFALVLSGAAGHAWTGIAVSLALMASHLALQAKPNEWLLLLIAGATGWLWETALHLTGLLTYPHWSEHYFVAPLWLAMLWVIFASTLLHSLCWLQGRWIACVMFGAVGGPLAFLAGEKLGAVVFANTSLALVVLAVAWAILTPTALFAANQVSQSLPSDRREPVYE